MNIRAHVFVSGRVQGVFFRAKTEQEAEKHGVFGWIRNLPDGRVEAVFEGEEKDVIELVEFCRKGPTGAQVTNTSVLWEKPTGEFRDFKTKYGHYY